MKKKWMLIYKKLYLKVVSNKKYCQFLKKQGIKMGEGCDIAKDVNFGSEPYLITLGHKVRITSGVKFITHDGGVWVLRNNGKLPNADLFGKITVGNNVHIGMNSIIMPGVAIGDNSIIGCGAIVTKDIPSNSVAAGIPAKVIESIDEYYNKNKEACDYTKNLSYEDKKKYLYKKYNIN